MESNPRDDLLSFHSETSSVLSTAQRLLRARRRAVIVCAATLLGAGSAAVVYVASTRLQAARTVTPKVDPSSGTAVIDSNPPGIVTIEGVVRGETPLSLRLPAGTHHVTIAAGQAARSVLLEIEAGSTTRQYVEFAPVSAPITTGRLDVSSQPPGARVTVDGAVKGTTPISLGEIAEGPHQLSIANGETTVRRSVTIRAGATSSVDVALSSAESSGGWLALTAPVELTLAEDNQVIGTTRATRVMLPAGTHNLVLSNAGLEFQTTMAVRIEGGKTVNRAVSLPTGLLSINAVPWANVAVDGGEIGTTPLANIPLPIGSHEVVWRHPQLGERRRTIVITAKTPTRVGMDFRQ
jgi:PEGA domain-containing protein